MEEAERISCQLLLTDGWPDAIRSLVVAQSVNEASWLTVGWVAELETHALGEVASGLNGPDGEQVS